MNPLSPVFSIISAAAYSVCKMFFTDNDKEEMSCIQFKRFSMNTAEHKERTPIAQKKAVIMIQNTVAGTLAIQRGR
jgi:hypothetical protein